MGRVWGGGQNGTRWVRPIPVLERWDRTGSVGKWRVGMLPDVTSCDFFLLRDEMKKDRPDFTGKLCDKTVPVLFKV